MRVGGTLIVVSFEPLAIRWSRTSEELQQHSYIYLPLQMKCIFERSSTETPYVVRVALEILDAARSAEVPYLNRPLT